MTNGPRILVGGVIRGATAELDDQTYECLACRITVPIRWSTRG